MAKSPKSEDQFHEDGVLRRMLNTRPRRIRKGREPRPASKLDTGEKG